MINHQNSPLVVQVSYRRATFLTESFSINPKCKTISNVWTTLLFLFRSSKAKANINHDGCKGKRVGNHIPSPPPPPHRYAVALARSHNNKIGCKHTKREIRQPKPSSNSRDTRARVTLANLSKPRRRRQRERHQTKGLMSRRMVMHVYCKSLYIFLPSSAKQQREMIKFSGF